MCLIFEGYLHFSSLFAPLVLFHSCVLGYYVYLVHLTQVILIFSILSCSFTYSCSYSKMCRRNIQNSWQRLLAESYQTWPSWLMKTIASSDCFLTSFSCVSGTMYLTPNNLLGTWFYRFLYTELCQCYYVCSFKCLLFHTVVGYLSNAFYLWCSHLNGPHFKPWPCICPLLTGIWVLIYIFIFVIPTAATQYADKKEIKEMDTKRTHTSLKPK